MSISALVELTKLTHLHLGSKLWYTAMPTRYSGKQELGNHSPGGTSDPLSHLSHPGHSPFGHGRVQNDVCIALKPAPLVKWRVDSPSQSTTLFHVIWLCVLYVLPRVTCRLTWRCLSATFIPFMCWIAFKAPWGSVMLTNPTPRHLLEFSSCSTFTLKIDPCGANLHCQEQLSWSCLTSAALSQS